MRFVDVSAVKIQMPNSYFTHLTAIRLWLCNLGAKIYSSLCPMSKTNLLNCVPFILISEKNSFEQLTGFLFIIDYYNQKKYCGCWMDG